MKTIKKKKYLGYLFWLGPVLTIMGITAKVVAGEWSLIALGLLIAGLVIIGLWLLFLGSLAPGFWGRRSTQVGTNAIISTLAVLVILGLINFLGVRYVQRVDLTENNLFSLSPQSQRVVQNLQQPVKLWMFDRQPNPADVELLKNYRRYGSKLEFEYIDPQEKPALARKFNVKSLGEVYLEYGAERKLLQMLSPAERLSEVKLTNGIEQITSGRTDTVYFLQGHGERPLEQVEGSLSGAVNALKEKNFIAQPLNLAERSEVPKDASVVVVAGPKRALFPGEVQALRNYLSAGGSLLLMLDPDTNPGVDSLLAEWGVQLERQIVVDASGQGRSVGLGPATPLVSSYGNHPITKDFGGGFSFYPLARPMEIQPVDGVKETPLISTNEQSWGESTPEKQPLEFDPKIDRPGPLILGVALSRKVQSPSDLFAPIPLITPTPQPSPTASPSGQPKASPTPIPLITPTPQPSPSTSPKTQPTTSSTPKPKATATPEASPSPSPKVQPTASLTPKPQMGSQKYQSLLDTSVDCPFGELAFWSDRLPTCTEKSQFERGYDVTFLTSTTLSQATGTPEASPSDSPKAQATTSPTAKPQATATPEAAPTASPSAQPTASPSPTKEDNADNKAPEARLVVYGNSNFATDGWFEQQLNGDVFLNSVSWLSKRDEQALSIRPKEQQNRRINLTAAQAGTLGWTAIAIVPLVGFMTAGVLWWRRR